MLLIIMGPTRLVHWPLRAQAAAREPLPVLGVLLKPTHFKPKSIHNTNYISFLKNNLSLDVYSQKTITEFSNTYLQGTPKLV